MIITRHLLLSDAEDCSGVVTWVESLPLASLGDFVRGRLGEAEMQGEEL
jgi:hypothetical protein